MFIENDELYVEINTLGAEIVRIVGKHDQINYMWKRDKSLWSNSAPVLFPIVGPLKNNEYRHLGQTYSMTQHGFARNSEFSVVLYTKDKIVLLLKDNEETLKQYPFHFELYVKFQLVENKLSVCYEVFNTDDKELYFQIGGHPAFTCPFMENENYQDYYIEFEKEEDTIIKIMDKVKKGMSYQREHFFENEKRFFLRQALFNRNAIIFENLKSKYVSLKSLQHDKEIRLYFNSYPLLGIWGAKRLGGLLAIEPWYGHGDYIDFDGEFKDKEYMIHLSEGKSYILDYCIEIVQ